MRKQDHLASLIRSLNAAEKRYFKLFAALQPGEKKYIKLFDLLESETPHDNAQLAKKLGHSAKQLAHEKEYLQKVLIKSLRNYNDEATTEIALESALIDIEVLYNKQQYGLAQTLINRYLRIAEEEEKFEVALQLLRWEKRCMRELGQYAYFEKQYSEILTRELELIAKLENLLQIGALQFTLFSIVNRNEDVVSSGNKKQLTAIIRHPLMKSPDNALSFVAKMLYYEILTHWYSHHYEYEKANQLSDTVLKLYDENPKYIQKHPWGYFTVISNYCNRCIAFRKAAETKVALNKMEQLVKMFDKKLPPVEIKRMEKSIILCKSNYYIITYNFTACAALIESIIPNLETPTTDYAPAFHSSLYFRAAFSYFSMGQFDKAIVYQRKILDNINDKVRMDQVLLTQVLSIITHIELHNYQLLPYLQKSVDRFVQTRGLNNMANKIVLKFLGTLIPTLKNAGKSKKILARYHQQLIPFQHDHSQNILLDSLDLLQWMETKMKSGFASNPANQ